MKSYTDIYQSEKLAEILPVDSADMCYRLYREEGGIPDYQTTLCPYHFASWIGIPCWSLAALLEVIREKVGYDLLVWDEGYNIDVYDLESGKVMTELYSNPVDAVVKTIYNLKERNLL